MTALQLTIAIVAVLSLAHLLNTKVPTLPQMLNRLEQEDLL